MNFKGKAAVVTGAAAGIGRATAIAFAEHGASVALLDCNVAGVEETAAMVRQKSGQALALRADVGIEREVADAFRQIGANFEQVDILINNAGVELYKDFLQFESAEWDRLLAVNLNSVYYCSKQAIPFMIRSGEGSILSLTRDMAREFGKHKIRVNSICPGCIHTPMMDRTLATMPNAEIVVG